MILVVSTCVVARQATRLRSRAPGGRRQQVSKRMKSKYDETPISSDSIGVTNEREQKK